MKTYFTKTYFKKFKTHKLYIIMSAIIFIAVSAAIVAVVNIKNMNETRNVLRGSITQQAEAAAQYALTMIDEQTLNSYNSPEDISANVPQYRQSFAELRELAGAMPNLRIYVFRTIQDEYFIVFDSAGDYPAAFEPYAFSAGVEPVAGENIVYGGKTAGMVAVYERGTLTEDISEATAANAVLLASLLAAACCVLFIAVYVVARRAASAQQQLFHMSHYDPLTKLPNRQYLLEYLKILTEERRQPFALLFIDLDNFKQVNDLAGHDAGDRLMQQIADFLQTSHEDGKSFRPSAGMLNISARIGGDEFIQVIPDVTDAGQAADIARDLIDNFSNHVAGKFISECGVGLSIGISLYPYHSENFHVLIKYADIAMYAAKHSGKNTFMIYDHTLKT